MTSACKQMVSHLWCMELTPPVSRALDAIEYLLTAGKIGHLSHEYAGKHLEKAMPNTHKPVGRKSEISLEFTDGSEVKAEIASNGTPQITGPMASHVKNWDYRRTVLRQDEVAAFIHETKGAKYLALLPLLGLHELDVAAENFRQLAKSVETQSKLKDLKAGIRVSQLSRKQILGSATDSEVLKKVEDMH